MVFFHAKEAPDYNDKFYSLDREKIKKIPLTLIVTGGSRNGNHLVWSLLDGHSKIPYIPGEDRVLSQISIRNLSNSKKFIKDLKKGKSNFIKSLSGMKFDKWKKLNSKKIDLNKWAGKHEEKYIPILEFPNLIHKVNNERYVNELKKGFKKIKNYSFYEVFYIYFL